MVTLYESKYSRMNKVIFLNVVFLKIYWVILHMYNVWLMCYPMISEKSNYINNKIIW